MECAGKILRDGALAPGGTSAAPAPRLGEPKNLPPIPFPNEIKKHLPLIL